MTFIYFMYLILLRRYWYLLALVLIIILSLILTSLTPGNSKIIVSEPTTTKENITPSNQTPVATPSLSNPALPSEIITLTPGLKIKYLVRGKGQTGGTTGDYKLSYTMRLSDGKLVKSGEKVVSIARSIAAWRLSLPTIPVGSKVIIYSDSSHSYGKTGVPGLIPPFENLIYEIELISTTSQQKFSNKVLLKTMMIGDGDPVTVNDTVKVKISKSLFYKNSFTEGSEYFSIKIPKPNNIITNWISVVDGSTVGSKLKIIVPPKINLPVIYSSSPSHGIPIYLDVEILSKDIN